MPAYTELILDTQAFYQNFKLLDAMPVMPMIKANGYGVGALELACLFTSFGAPYLGVSYLHEAISLRQAGICLPILALSFLPHEAHLAVTHRITVAVDTLEKVMALNQAAQQPHPVHLKINSGLNRFGVATDRASLLLHAIQHAQHLFLEGIMTHLMGAKDPSLDAVTTKQLSVFDDFVKRLPHPPQWIHANASSSYNKFHSSVSNLARIGFGLFSPHSPVTLRTRVMGLQEVQPGEGVGYCSLPLQEPRKIAVLGLGYHDGWHPSYGPNTCVWIHGHYAPVIGQICMDFMMVDITDCVHPIKVGDWCEILGPHRSLESTACSLEINPRVLLTHLSSRIQRVWVHQECLQKTLEQEKQPTLI